MKQAEKQSVGLRISLRYVPNLGKLTRYEVFICRSNAEVQLASTPDGCRAEDYAVEQAKHFGCPLFINGEEFTKAIV